MSTNTDRLVNDLKRVTEDAEEILKDTREDISEKACAARQRLVATIESAKAQCQKLEEKAVATARATDKVIREHPYQSLGIVLGVGLLAGYLLKRK